MERNVKLLQSKQRNCFIIITETTHEKIGEKTFSAVCTENFLYAFPTGRSHPTLLDALRETEALYADAVIIEPGDIELFSNTLGGETVVSLHPNTVRSNAGKMTTVPIQAKNVKLDTRLTTEAMFFFQIYKGMESVDTKTLTLVK